MTAHGYPSDIIARAVLGRFWSYSGSEVAFWDDWKKEFLTLLENEDMFMKKICQAGCAFCDANLMHARRNEHHEEIYGITGDE